MSKTGNVRLASKVVFREVRIDSLTKNDFPKRKFRMVCRLCY